jgi:hypothetical protein
LLVLGHAGRGPQVTLDAAGHTDIVPKSGANITIRR